MRKFTPEAIASLQENEIFVFGSYMNGNHAGGAAQDCSIIACRRSNTIELSGSNNIVVCANGSKIKGKIGNAICFVDFDNENNIKNAISAIIDGETLKEGVFYKFENGRIVEF